MPADFDGIFYGPTTGGHEMFDSSPEKFIEMCVRAESPLGSAQFYVAGALADFLWQATRANDYAERWQRLSDAASQKWPTHCWTAIPVIILTAKNILREGVSREQVGFGISSTVAKLFGGADFQTQGDTIIIRGRETSAGQ